MTYIYVCRKICMVNNPCPPTKLSHPAERGQAEAEVNVEDGEGGILVGTRPVNQERRDSWTIRDQEINREINQ